MFRLVTTRNCYTNFSNKWNQSGTFLFSAKSAAFYTCRHGLGVAMTFEELREAAEVGFKTETGRMILAFPRGFKRPQKFPRGELLCENSEAQCVWSFDAWRILKWLDWAEAAPVTNTKGAA